MLADFAHCEPREVTLANDLRKDLRFTDKDLEVLEVWIEGPISKARRGYFQVFDTDVRVSDLVDPKKVKTVKSLLNLIWKSTPVENRVEE
jgi:hypothetical protein